MTKSEALARVNGNASVLARILGLTPQAIYQWRGERIPPLQAYRLRELRPEWFLPKKSNQDGDE
jgi:hypothetical protein